MSTSAIGSSGQMIDVSGIVSKLVALETRPLDKLKQRISTTQMAVNSMSEVKGLVDAAYSAANALGSSLLLQGRNASSSSEALVKASITDASLATTDTIAVRPLQLASAQRSTLGGFSSASTALSPDMGTLTLDLPAGSTLLADADGDGLSDAFAPVEISMGGKTLTEIRDEINSKLSGTVSVRIINTGDSSIGYVLVVSGAKTGSEAGFTMSLDENTVNSRQDLGLLLGGNLATQAGVAAALTYDAAASDARAELYSGSGSEITVQSATNSFSKALPGVSFELMKVPSGSDPLSASVTVSDNTTEIEAKVKSFATAFSDLIKRLGVLTKPGTPTTQAGPLASNSGVLGLSSSLMSGYSRGFTLSDSRTYTSDAGNVIGNAASPLSWSQLGLNLARDGTVSLDAAVLRTTLSSGLGDAIKQGFTSDILTSLNAFRGVGGGLQGTIDTMKVSLTSLSSDQSALEARIERTRQNLLKKYSSLDARLVEMNQMSANVRSALSGLAA